MPENVADVVAEVDWTFFAFEENVLSRTLAEMYILRGMKASL